MGGRGPAHLLCSSFCVLPGYLTRASMTPSNPFQEFLLQANMGPVPPQASMGPCASWYTYVTGSHRRKANK